MGTDKHITMPVDIGRLTEGLKMAFHGVSEVFGSIGAGEEATEMVAGVASSVWDAAGNQKTQKPGKKATAESTDAETAMMPDKKTEDTESEKGRPEETQNSSVTMPEIIKIVTRKIEADRKNSDRIGQIVSSFGISKLTDLPENKYEAFLTQLTAL